MFDLNGNPVKAVKFANDVTQTKLKASDSAGWVTAISQAQAVLEFDLTNIIPDANEIF